MANLCIKTPSSASLVLIFQLLVLRPRPSARAVSRKTPLYFILRNTERIVFYESTRERHTVVLFKISILSNLVMQAKSENI